MCSSLYGIWWLIDYDTTAFFFCSRRTQNKKAWAQQNSTIKTLFIRSWLVFITGWIASGNERGKRYSAGFSLYCFLKAKKSQKTFKWALQSFTVLRIKTPGTNEKHVSAGCRPHASVQHFYFIIIIIWSVAFVTAGCFCFISHSLSISYKLWLNVCSSGEHRLWRRTQTWRKVTS